MIIGASSARGSCRHNRNYQESRQLLRISGPMLVLGLHAEYAHVGLCGVDRWANPEHGYALCRPRSRSEEMLVDEVSARLNLEHVDLAAEF